MARTAKALTALANDAGVDSAAAYTAVDQPNGHAITNAGSKDADKLVLVVKNTTAGPLNVTIKAASGDPWAQHKGVGDLVVSVPATGERAIALGDGARYRQPDGNLWVDYQVGFAGSIAAFLLP
jgi:hypothetical protein